MIEDSWCICKDLDFRVVSGWCFKLVILICGFYSFGLIRTINCVAEPANAKEAVRWLYQSAMAGYVRAQYQLALCLHQGRGVDYDMQEAVCNSIFHNFSIVF